MPKVLACCIALACAMVASHAAATSLAHRAPGSLVGWRHIWTDVQSIPVDFHAAPGVGRYKRPALWGGEGALLADAVRGTLSSCAVLPDLSVLGLAETAVCSGVDGVDV